MLRRPQRDRADLKDRHLAAILALKHSFIVDNFNCGKPELGNLKVYGAIAGDFSNGMTGVFERKSSIHGYGYDLEYDNRIQVGGAAALPQPDPGRLVYPARDADQQPLASTVATQIPRNKTPGGNCRARARRRIVRRLGLRRPRSKTLTAARSTTASLASASWERSARWRAHLRFAPKRAAGVSHSTR